MPHGAEEQDDASFVAPDVRALRAYFGHPDAVTLRVKDNGQGFTPDNCPGSREGHFGLDIALDALQPMASNPQVTKKLASVLLTDSERGFCYFADNDKGWILDPKRSGLALVMSSIGCHAQHLACFGLQPRHCRLRQGACVCASLD